MGRDSIGRLIEGLEAEYEALQVEEDDFVANDLAHALRQGRHLVEVLRSGPWQISVATLPPTDLEAVAEDHVVCGGGRLLVPLGSGVFTRGRGLRPARSVSTIRRAMNRIAREGGRVQLASGGGEVSGRVVAVGSDYLELDTPLGRRLVPTASVVWIRLSRAGSADAC